MPEQAIAIAPDSPAPTITPSPAPASRPTAPIEKPATTETVSNPGEADSIFDRMETKFKPATKEPPKDEKKESSKLTKDKVDEATPKTTAPSEKLDEKDDKSPKWYRENLKTVNAELEELRKSKTALEAKVKDYESKGKDTTALTEQLAREQKEKEDLLAQNRMLKKEVDPAFKEKWDKPFDQAAEYAKHIIEGLEVKSKDENGDVTSTRPAKWGDFVALYNLPIAKAARSAREMFGDDAGLVITKLEQLHQLDYQRRNALEEEKTKWKENESQEIAAEATRRENFQKASDKTRQDLVNEHPDWYDESPDDPEGNALLKEGRDYMEYKPKTFDEAVRVFERNKLNAIAFPRMQKRAEKAEAEVSELKATIEEMKNSGPGKTKRTTQDKASEGKSFEDEMREAVQV